MPVNGIGSPSAPRVSGPSNPQQTPEAVGPAPQQPNAGWAAGTNAQQRPVDFALSASHDSKGDSRVGAGVRIRF